MRLLVVEDEARMAGALQRGLAAEGFAVDVAGDGRKGLELARHGEYDAMILDGMLPGLSGDELVRTLGGEKNWLPVLMLSAKDGEYDQADGLDVGADDYLTKPFSYVVLLARLRALLRRGTPSRPAGVPVGDIDLDLAPPARARPRHAVAAGGAHRRRHRPGSGDPHRDVRRCPGFLDGAGVRPAGVPDAPAGPGGVEDRAARPRVGRGRRHCSQRGRGVRRLSASQDRPGPAGDGAGRGLPIVGP